VPRLAWAEEEFRVVLREAEMDYVRRLTEEIANGTLDGVQWWQSIHGQDGQAETDS
jgi:hypothetical protein